MDIYNIQYSVQALYVNLLYVIHPCDISPQLFSSDRSPQSSLKSHTWLRSTHTLLLHVNILSGHEGWGSEKETNKYFMNVNQLEQNRGPTKGK